MHWILSFHHIGSLSICSSVPSRPISEKKSTSCFGSTKSLTLARVEKAEIVPIGRGCVVCCRNGTIRSFLGVLWPLIFGERSLHKCFFFYFVLIREGVISTRTKLSVSHGLFCFYRILWPGMLFHPMVRCISWKKNHRSVSKFTEPSNLSPGRLRKSCTGALHSL
jgi:hypothetical protein